MCVCVRERGQDIERVCVRARDEKRGAWVRLRQREKEYERERKREREREREREQG